MIKDKLKELLELCVDNGINFDYSAHTKGLTIRKVTDAKRGCSEYVVNHYLMQDWNGTEEQHIAKLNEFIEQINGMN